MILRAIALLLLLGGCETRAVLVAPEASLERMIEQPKLDAYEASGFFADGRAMQLPPRGTVPYRRDPPDSRIELGIGGNGELQEIPLPVDAGLLQRGRNRYEIFCATCHGIRGDGKSVVAEQMDLLPPPSLLSDRIRAYSPGRIFRIASDGFGVMPSYRAELSARDRWSVVAYIEALQLRDRASLSDLPPEVANEAKEQLQ